ncbi:CAHM6 protein, partial [Sagittarius serpentarius]|nr:CAHM6 protein [Sagittarius serpentarius]
MDKLQGALEFCIRHQTALGYSTVSLLTAVSEYIFSSVLFQCPCNSENMLYGSVFLIVPAFILFLLGCMVHARTWCLLMGICLKKKPGSCQPWGTFCCRCLVLLPVAAKASVAPLTWIVVALLRASFYECAVSGSSLIQHVCKDKGQECLKLLLKIPCKKLPEEIQGEFLSLQAQSQLIGWFLIVSTMTVALIVKSVTYCCSPVSYLQLKFWKIYWKKERELFRTKAEEHATKLAEINVNCFFESTNPAPFQTPSSEDWQKISSLYASHSQEQYYSVLHQYVNTNRGNSTRPGEGGQNPPVLGSVDEENASESGF